MRIWITLICAVGMVGCLDRPEIRVELDRKVGIREVEGLGSVVVHEGSAQVWGFSDDSLELMGQAPGFTFEVTVFAPVATFTIALNNSMPAAQLLQDDGTADATLVPLAESPYPTRSTWVVPNLPAGTTRFRIVPETTSGAAPFRFAFLSDVQEAQWAVQDIYDVLNQDPSLQFVVGGGDLTHRGYEEEIQFALEQLTHLNVPLFSTSGNHDVGWGEERVWFEYMGRNSFHFVFRGVHFSFVDSAAYTLPTAVYDWLREWLELGHDSVHIFTTHVPPIDPVAARNAAFSSRIEAQKLLALLAEGGVDLTLYGHIHSYYTFTNAGIPAYIAGGGGGPDEKLDGIYRHYLAIDVDPALGVTRVELVRID